MITVAKQLVPAAQSNYFENLFETCLPWWGVSRHAEATALSWYEEDNLTSLAINLPGNGCIALMSSALHVQTVR